MQQEEDFPTLFAELQRGDEKNFNFTRITRSTLLRKAN